MKNAVRSTKGSITGQDSPGRRRRRRRPKGEGHGQGETVKRLRGRPGPGPESIPAIVYAGYIVNNLSEFESLGV